VIASGKAALRGKLLAEPATDTLHTFRDPEED
jgi:hypothetical protein